MLGNRHAILVDSDLRAQWIAHVSNVVPLEPTTGNHGADAFAMDRNDLVRCHSTSLNALYDIYRLDPGFEHGDKVLRFDVSNPFTVAQLVVPFEDVFERTSVVEVDECGAERGSEHHVIQFQCQLRAMSVSEPDSLIDKGGML